MKKYSVITPEVMFYAGSYDPPAPPEFGRDYVEVEANTKKEARVVAVREFRNRKSKWIEERRGDDLSPFTGLLVEE